MLNLKSNGQISSPPNDDLKLPRMQSSADAKSMGPTSSPTSQPKLCNNFHLRGECYYGEDCKYKHGTLNQKERARLRAKAKSSVCRFGGECKDRQCFSGHSPFRTCDWQVRSIRKFQDLPTSRKRFRGSFS